MQYCTILPTYAFIDHLSKYPTGPSAQDVIDQSHYTLRTQYHNTQYHRTTTLESIYLSHTPTCTIQHLTTSTLHSTHTTLNTHYTQHTLHSTLQQTVSCRESKNHVDISLRSLTWLELQRRGTWLRNSVCSLICAREEHGTHLHTHTHTHLVHRHTRTLYAHTPSTRTATLSHTTSGARASYLSRSINEWSQYWCRRPHVNWLL